MLEKILPSVQYVADNSKDIQINESKLKDFAKAIKIEEQTHWLSDSPYDLLELPIEKIVNFLLLYESIDFCFWGEPKWSINLDNKRIDGSSALMYVLLSYIKEKNIIDFSDISKEEFYTILRGNIEIPLLENRYKIIKDVSKTVNEKMNGNFFYYIKDITNDTELFNIIIKNFANFKDERKYNEKTIYFYKLAQLLTSDILHIRKIKENLKVDYTHLVGCADYKIPQILRELEILEYSNKLSNIIDKKQEIKENSNYEIEIRANTLIVINMIKKDFNNQMCSIDINDYIWKMSHKNILKPYHRTRTINY